MKLTQVHIYTFTPRLKKHIFPRKCITEVVRIGSMIIIHLSMLWKAKFFITVIFTVEAAGGGGGGGERGSDIEEE